jgi:hypothetical protein
MSKVCHGAQTGHLFVLVTIIHQCQFFGPESLPPLTTMQLKFGKISLKRPPPKKKKKIIDREELMAE